jgi:hypothetical protein
MIRNLRPYMHSFIYQNRNNHWRTVWGEVWLAQLIKTTASYSSHGFSSFVCRSIAVKMQDIHVTIPIRPSLITTFNLLKPIGNFT